MLTLHTLQADSATTHRAKRVGRGNGSGKGTFSGKGCKGQNSRSGGGVPDWFEGGQTPLFRRMPKLKGFSNDRFMMKYQVVNLSDIELLAQSGITEITLDTLFEQKLTRKRTLPVKLLGTWTLSKAVTISVHKASETAQKALEKAGGTLQILALNPEQK